MTSFFAKTLTHAKKYFKLQDKFNYELIAQQSETYITKQVEQSSE